MRVIVVGVVRNALGEVLLCKMPAQRGVFPGQWGLPGGGIETGETAEIALRRELREEIGLEMSAIQPLFFTSGTYTKIFPDGNRQDSYMIFLLFSCQAAEGRVLLNEEFTEFAWVELDSLREYDLNGETAKTFQRLGWI